MKPIHAEAIECFQSLGLGEIGGISLVDIGALTIWLHGGATAINPATLANKGLQTYLRGLGSPAMSPHHQHLPRPPDIKCDSHYIQGVFYTGYGKPRLGESTLT